MPTVNEIKTQAQQLVKARNYTDALPLFKTLWDEHREDCNEWEGWRYAFCLKQLREYKPALEICREVYKIKPSFENIKGLYAWCVYYTEISIEKISNESNLFKAAEGIIKLSKQEDKSVKKEKDFPCVYTLAVFRILEYLNEKAIYNPDKIIYWTDKLNPEFLEVIPFVTTDNQGKERELAPQKEKWFALRTKALFEFGQFEDCISLSEQALTKFTKFHYDNDIWLKRYIALSKAGLGEIDLALSELKELLKRKNEWFIQKEISEIYKQQNKLDEAISYAVDGALNNGDADKKMNLYKLLAELLKAKGKTNEAKTHIEFIFYIRKVNQWKIDLELSNLIQELSIDTSKDFEIRELQLQLKSIWEQLKFGSQELLKGAIRTIIADGKAGFVDTVNKESYFFSSKSFKGRRELMQIGQKVTFFLEDSFDKKKNQPTKIAVNIKPVR
jgi:hypothetical protein